MKISLSWLRDFVPFDGSPEELAEILTHLGLSVESLERIGAAWNGIVVGKVVACEPVAGSDHLSYCQVEAGLGELLPIVCGAPNVAAGQTVTVALVGAELPIGLKITERKLRGLLSRGMICSERELGLSEEHQGILVLSEDCVIGRSVEEYLGGVDWVFDLEVTFNRPDCLSHLGVAREIAAKTGLPLKMPPADPVEAATPTSEWVTVEIHDPERCPRYSARVVRGIKVAPSPLWMQNRLKAVGVRPISNVVDVTNYAMMELGHPLHAFDYHLIKDGRIIVRRASLCEKFVTLDGKEHTLADSDLLIADPERGIALAGVMGGLNTEINDATRDVLIECAVFDPVGIRCTSRDRGIASESSRRFERGVDPQMTLYAASRTAYLIQQLAGGQVLSGCVDAYPKKWRQPAIALRPARANAILATDLDAERMGNYLRALSCEVAPTETDDAAPSALTKVSGTLTVHPASWRGDLEREIDLIEEIIRLHGYDEVGLAVTSQVPLEPDVARERERRLTDRIKRALVELGTHEAVCWSLISAADAAAVPNGLKPVRIINPLSEDLCRLRASLAPSLFRVVERNLNAGIEDVRLFEWGKCFWMERGEVREELRLAVAVCGRARPESWTEPTRSFELADLTGLLLQLASRLQLDSPQLVHYDTAKFLQTGGRLAVGPAATVNLGHFGQIVPEVAARFGIERPLWYIELNGDRLLQAAGQTPQFQPLPRYPVARRDLALVVNVAVCAGDLQATLAGAGGELIERVELFDVYAGRGIPDGKKSLAFHLIFRSSERTLSDTEVEALTARMIETARREFDAELRSL